MKRSSPLRPSRLRPVSATMRRVAKQDREWRVAVFERDGERCKMPNCVRLDIEAHHIVGKPSPRLRLMLGNGVTLCRAHHRYAHDHSLAFAPLVDEWFGAGHLDGLRAIKYRRPSAENGRETA